MDSCAQVQRKSAGVVRRVFEPLQFVPYCLVIEAFKNELKGFSTSKGTIHFPKDKPLPTALVKKPVKARVAQNEGKKRR